MPDACGALQTQKILEYNIDFDADNITTQSIRNRAFAYVIVIMRHHQMCWKSYKVRYIWPVWRNFAQLKSTWSLHTPKSVKPILKLFFWEKMMSKVEIGMVSKSQPVSQGTRKPYRFKVYVFLR